MDKALFNRVKQTLLTHCPPDTSGRVALTQSAWVSESRLLNLVEYNGNNDVFATHLLTTAVRYGTLSDGQHALIALLEVLTQRVGERERDTMNHLIMEVTRAYAPENIQKTHDIFLSYSSRELAAMQRVKAVLISEGFSVWTDEGLVAGTPDWVQAIDEALRASRAWVGLYSPIANKSTWIREEFLTAQALELPLFPVVIAGNEQLPMGLRGVQATFIEHDWDALKRELVPALASALGKETPSMLQKRLDEQKAAYVRELEALRLEREQLELERQQQDLQAERKRLAAEQAERERLAAEQAERDRITAEKAERERLAAEKAERERIAAEKAERERLAAEQAQRERLAAEKAQRDRLAAEQAERERLATEKAERERIASEKAQRERLAAEKTERERLAAEKTERERLATEKAKKSRFGFLGIVVGILALVGFGYGGLSLYSPRPSSFITPIERDFNGVTMVQVPAGCFMMGSTSQSDEQPVHEQCFEAPFWIDKFEVTQAQFAAFNGVKANPNRFTGENRPVESITWFEARDFCALRDARLPTEVEWEYAARGPDGLTYPWGNRFLDANGVYSRNSNHQTSNVGSRSEGMSWVGAYDMSGNVQEWVSSVYRNYPYSYETHESIDDTNSMRVLRGGSWLFISDTLRAAFRDDRTPDVESGINGFRCARS